LTSGRAIDRKHRQRRNDLLEGQPHALGDPDEGDPTKDIAPEPSLTARGAFGVHKPLTLVKADGRGSQAAPFGHVADGEHLFHGCHAP
jgi:hypothetical protein